MNITLDNVSKSFNGHHAIKNIDIEIKSGEFVSLLGPSGCGKSTTLMMLAGLLHPTSGNIHFGNERMNGVEPRKRNIGMVFQSYALYPHLSVMDNIAFPLKQRRVSKTERREKALEIAKIVHLEAFLDRKPSQLSGGQQQRVAMARALIKQPNILLLDEPMSNLDTRLKIDMREEVRHIQKMFNITTIMVTHDQEEALAMADRIAILDDGYIQQFASPKKLYEQPDNMFVANFLGNPPMNFLEGALRTENNKQLIEGEGFSYTVPADLAFDGQPDGQQLMVGFRGHQVAIDYSAQEGSIKAKVRYVEMLGRESLIHVVIGKHTVRLLVKEIEAAHLPEFIFIRPQHQGTHIFEKESGKKVGIYNAKKEVVTIG